MFGQTKFSRSILALNEFTAQAVVPCGYKVGLLMQSSSALGRNCPIQSMISVSAFE